MATAAAADCIGPYRAIRQLGAGGLGEVFLAHDEELGRNIAIKLLPAHLASDAEHLARLRNEARSASSLNHPNIVTIYEIGRDESRRAFMAMEYELADLPVTKVSLVSYVMHAKYRAAEPDEKTKMRESVAATFETLPAGETRERVGQILDRLR